MRSLLAAATIGVGLIALGATGATAAPMGLSQSKNAGMSHSITKHVQSRRNWRKNRWGRRCVTKCSYIGPIKTCKRNCRW